MHRKILFSLSSILSPLKASGVGFGVCWGIGALRFVLRTLRITTDHWLS